MALQNRCEHRDKSAHNTTYTRTGINKNTFASVHDTILMKFLPQLHN